MREMDKKSTADFDRGFEFEEIGLIDEDFARGGAELFDFGFSELD